MKQEVEAILYCSNNIKTGLEKPTVNDIKMVLCVMLMLKISIQIISQWKSSFVSGPDNIIMIITLHLYLPNDDDDLQHKRQSLNHEDKKTQKRAFNI